MNRILPAQIDNTYCGYRAALVVLGVLLAIKTLMSVNCIINGYAIATNADGIPLDTFSPEAAKTIVVLFANWGFAHLALTIVGILVLFRYRSAVPFMFALMLSEILARKAAQQLMFGFSAARQSPAFYVNGFLILLMSAGLVLSLLKRRAEVPV